MKPAELQKVGGKLVQSIKLHFTLHRPHIIFNDTHTFNDSKMRFNIGPRATLDSSLSASGSVPNDHPPIASSSRRPPPQCPMHNSDSPKCPIDHTKQDPNNPLNQIPANLSLKRQPNQTVDLPTERTISTIPRPQSEADDGTTWDYPSPQQFYNALVRKGWETPEDSVEMMVDIHNFLNERAWREVMRWEAKMPG
jgi:cytochrome c heme-lyase